MKFIRTRCASAKALLSNPLLRKLAGNTGWLLADRVVRLGLGVVILAWTARYLGPNDFGLLNYAQAIVVLFTSVAQFGLTDIVIRDLVRHPDRLSIIISTAFFMRIVMGLVAVGLSCLTVYLLKPSDQLALFITFSLSISLLLQAGEVLEYDLQAQNRVTPTVAARSGSFIVCNALKIAGILAGAELPFFAIMIAIEAAVTMLLLIAANRRGWRLLSYRHLSLTELTYFLTQSAPLFLRTAAIAVYMRLDHILIGQFYGDAAVGNYAAAVRLAEVWFFLPMAVMTALVPTLANTYIIDQQAYQRQLKKVIRLLLYGSVVFSIIVTVISQDIIFLLYGEEYETASDILRIYVWSSIFGTLGLATNAWFVNSGLMKYAFHQAFLGLLLNASIGVLLIWTIGPIGGAIAYLVSQAITNYLLNWFFKATRPIFRLQTAVLTLR